MDKPDTGTCTRCGAQLQPGLRFCRSCGKPLEGRAVATVRLLCLGYAAGAIFLLVLLAETAATLAAPHGREAMMQTLAQAGVPPDQQGAVLTFYAVLVVLLEVGGAGLHGLAYKLMRRRRLAGWVIAVALAGAWSLILVGIPALLVLLRPAVRREFGLTT